MASASAAATKPERTGCGWFGFDRWRQRGLRFYGMRNLTRHVKSGDERRPMRLKIEAPIALVPGLVLVAVFEEIALVIFLLWRRDAGVADEDHLVEWLQAACLGAASLIHFHRGRGAYGDLVPTGGRNFFA